MGATRATRSLRATLLRSSLTATGAFTVLVTAAVAAAGPSAEEPPGGPGVRGMEWKESYSVRFPGCVSPVLWPAEEEPVAYLARRPGGAVVEVPATDIEQVRALRSRDLQTIGYCR